MCGTPRAVKEELTQKENTGKLLEEKFKGRIPLEEKQGNYLWASIRRRRVGDETGVERTNEVFIGSYIA